jgi:hypothetical protein
MTGLAEKRGTMQGDSVRTEKGVAEFHGRGPVFPSRAIKVMITE